MMGSYTCVKYYKDGYKPCKSSDDCEGDCIVDSNNKPVPYCQRSDNRFGCFGTVEDFNKNIPIICRD